MSDRKRQQEVYLDQLKQLVPGVNSHTASKVIHLFLRHFDPLDTYAAIDNCN